MYSPEECTAIKFYEICSILGQHIDHQATANINTSKCIDTQAGQLNTLFVMTAQLRLKLLKYILSECINCKL